ncbi:MAG: hypothetical protein ACE5H2_08045 [Terriglobia bacterium]
MLAGKPIARLTLITAALALLVAGCTVKQTRRLPPSQVLPLRQASLTELLERIRQQHDSIRSLNARAELIPSTGSAYSGVIEEYRDVRAFILARRATPADTPDTARAQSQIRLIGQAPVVRKNIFDMVANDEEFRIYIPPKNKFIVGRTTLTHQSKKPMENLRPQHLLEALFVPPPAATATHLREENEIAGQRYYVVNEIDTEAGALRLRRKWWFRRTNLALVRVQRFGPEGELLSDVHYDVWTQHGRLRYPHWIQLVRPQDDYRLTLRFDKVDLNPDLKPEKFRLEPPAGAERVDLTRAASEQKPAARARPQPQP